MVGIILAAVGLAYAVDTLAPILVAELAFTVWLLRAGRRSSAVTRVEASGSNDYTLVE